MTTSPRQPDDQASDQSDDERLWSEALRDLARNHHPPRTEKSTDLPELSVQNLQSILYLPSFDRAYQATLAGSEILSFRQTGMSDRQVKKIFKYPFLVHHSLDLHHMTGQAGYDACQYTLVSCYIKNLRKIRIICGIGHHSQGMSLMKGVAVSVLNRANFVLAYQSADDRSGGTGAIDIYLKQAPDL